MMQEREEYTTPKDAHDVNGTPETPQGAPRTGNSPTSEPAPAPNPDGPPEALPPHLDPASHSFDPAAGLERWAEQMDL